MLKLWEIYVPMVIFMFLHAIKRSILNYSYHCNTSHKRLRRQIYFTNMRINVLIGLLARSTLFLARVTKHLNCKKKNNKKKIIIIK